MKLRMRAEVPFSHGAGRVACAAQRIRERGLAEWQSDHRAGRIPLWVELVAEALLIAAGEKAGA